MSNIAEPTPSTGVAVETDLVTALQQVLQASEEPLTLSKIRAKLPTRLREVELDELATVLNRQVAAQVLYPFPKYRSQQDRYWDRPMPVHIAALLHESLIDGAMGWSDLRRRLPAYAQAQAEEVLHEQVAKGKLFRHPRFRRCSGASATPRPIRANTCATSSPRRSADWRSSASARSSFAPPRWNYCTMRNGLRFRPRRRRKRGPRRKRRRP